MPQTWRGEQILELAVQAVKAQDFDRAAHLCVQAIKVQPDLAEAWHIRGIAKLRKQEFFDALYHFNQTLELKPEMGDVWNNRGYACAELGLWDMAIDSFQRSVAIVDTPEPHILCGGMYAHLMKLEEAEEEFKLALELEPENQDAHVKLGVIQLGLGNWLDGFKQYHWRWFDTIYPSRPFRSFPQWRGEELAHKKLLLFAEQGYGDEIMSLRFVDSVSLYCGDIVLEVRPTVKRLAEDAMGHLCEVIASGDDYPYGIDYSLPLLDVPMVLERRPDEIPQPPRYLRTPEIPAEILGRIPNDDTVKIGLCWGSGRRPLQPETERSASAKSIPLELFRPLMSLPGITWVSLQMPKQTIPRDFPILDLTDHIDDVKNTAEIIAALDLVISVDTLIAHLAGAMGIPVWNLVRFNGYWPWMRETDKTIWYPSMEIFRQPELGDWPSVITRLVAALSKPETLRRAA